MTIDIKAPAFPESIADGTVATWHKKPGEAVSRDELIVDIETDKVVLEIVAPADGVISEIIKAEGETVLSNELIGLFAAGEAGTVAAVVEQPVTAAQPQPITSDLKLSPAARKMIEENKVEPAAVVGTGKGGLVTKEDVMAHLASAPVVAPVSKAVVAAPVVVLDAGEKIEKRVPMTRLRKRIAERLLDATQNTAMLTTFNEVNMEPVMTLRSQYKDLFEKTHNGVRLGFMGFFVKAACEALKRYPAVNASIDGDDVVYHGYQDVGVAVSSDKGLVVPVLRDVDNMGLATVENTIRDFGLRARDGKLSLDDMQGGTFTITNGGVFGSLMSTPIINPPQTAILGMHKIQDRPMAVNGEVKILPMMYLALSYDHRLIDGKEAVQFLVTIKDLLEDPARILLEI
ncbi:2-oxoglutarate dehydrogenase complex dihydrolipoyllysine-residue succinyltransferase [Oceanicoccus sp. KOV_DT_Chl]|uniref:2-oxoglutarate dehydrogenase complex dihydrolipoyllysine-residue succinyltransferase n=1 Tax=Oceanicoccus sp. KOV_DT_Chl TaxID=1904639 RepID=UPI000C7BABAA|nr:2-oxoglutarate dehydrogenase complex dihydrolipoyllysine-residue succinyltransferase [Oceanicoccus sp. KOV_DT_Chl]